MSIKICFVQTESMFLVFYFPLGEAGKTELIPPGAPVSKKSKMAKPRNKAFANSKYSNKTGLNSLILYSQHISYLTNL